MKLITYITENIEFIKQGIKIGLVPCTLEKHIQIYCRYDYYRKQGHPVGLAVIYTSEDLKTCQSLIFKVIRKMESEV